MRTRERFSNDVQTDDVTSSRVKLIGQSMSGDSLEISHIRRVVRRSQDNLRKSPARGCQKERRSESQKHVRFSREMLVRRIPEMLDFSDIRLEDPVLQYDEVFEENDHAEEAMKDPVWLKMANSRNKDWQDYQPRRALILKGEAGYYQPGDSATPVAYEGRPKERRSSSRHRSPSPSPEKNPIVSPKAKSLHWRKTI